MATPLPDHGEPLVLRTDFTDDERWRAVRRASEAGLPDGIENNTAFVSDPDHAGLTIPQIVDLVSSTERNHVFVADADTNVDPELRVLAVDLLHEPGRTFRATPAEIWSLWANLSDYNMDFFEFADAVDEGTPLT